MEANEMTQIMCPYCAQAFEIEIDHTGGQTQEWVTDCEVCCRPIIIRVHQGEEGPESLEVLPEMD